MATMKLDPKMEHLSSSTATNEEHTSFMDLPTELQLLITSHLTYPDALSLKHTNQHLYNLVFTGVKLKIEWLIERRKMHLDCPHDKGCELGSDMRFCRGSIRLLMKRRREHGECQTRRGGRGCLVFGTERCASRLEQMGVKATAKRWVKRLFIDTTVFLWVLLAVAGLAIAWGWLEMRRMERSVRI